MGTGQISYTEFLAGLMDLRRVSAQEMDRLLLLVWQQFSADQAGHVKIGELQAAFAARGMTVAEMPQAFLNLLRQRSSKTITFDDFKALFRGDDACCVMSSFIGG